MLRRLFGWLTAGPRLGDVAGRAIDRLEAAELALEAYRAAGGSLESEEGRRLLAEYTRAFDWGVAVGR